MYLHTVHEHLEYASAYVQFIQKTHEKYLQPKKN